MSKFILYRTPEVLTYEKWISLGLLCKFLRPERPPAIVYESLQYARVDGKKGSSVFVWLLANRLVLIYLAGQYIM